MWYFSLLRTAVDIKNTLVKRHYHSSRVIKRLFSVVALSWGLALLPLSGLAALIIDSDTSFWSAITYGMNVPDPFIDQQTGLKSGDLVGDANHAAFYTQFDDGGTATDLTDGTLAFRIRLNEAKNYSNV